MFIDTFCYFALLFSEWFSWCSTYFGVNITEQSLNLCNHFLYSMCGVYNETCFHYVIVIMMTTSSSMSQCCLPFVDAADLKQKSLFKALDWDHLLEMTPPFVPCPDDDQDTQYFEGECQFSSVCIMSPCSRI